MLCKGICEHIRIGYNSIEEFLENNSENIENGILSTSDQDLIRYMLDYLEVLGEDKFKIDRTRLLKYFLIETEMEKKFCEKFDLAKVENEIDKLPKEINLVPYEELEEEYGFREVEKMIETILINCEISSEMSFNDVLRCSKAVSLLFGSLISTVIEDIDVYFFWYPSLKQIILVKLLFDKRVYEEQEEEELGYIITKVDNFFCASNPYSNLYFNLFDEDDPTIQEHFEKLKSLKGD